MPQVREEIIIKGKINQIYQIVSTMEKYPEFMPNVKQVELVEQTKDYQITRWKTEVDGKKINWSEKDIFKREDNRILFKQIEGDLKEFSGFWQLNSRAEGVVVLFFAQFELGIPGLSTFINPIIKRKLAFNARQMLLSFKRKIENRVEQKKQIE